MRSYKLEGRITKLIKSGELFDLVGGAVFNRETDRAMICGSMGMTLDTKALMEEFGLDEGSNSNPADFVIEKAFVG